ncbi:MAG: HAD-IA family hydrolase [Clostridia bacterium]|nr:HAD-IA family hydrolase [Clostridia bacterium]
MIEYVLFDLDGTLTDSAPGILNSIEYALNKKNLKYSSREELRRFLGPPLTESFMEYFNLSFEESYDTVMCFREYFSEKGIFENEVYDGIKDLLENTEKKFALATAKPEHFAKRILEHFDLIKHFDVVCGSPPEEKDCPKSEIIERALKELGVCDKTKAVMVGDRKYDAKGAHDAGLKAVGVLYGYGSKQELKEAKFDFIAKDVNELKHILNSI